MAVVLLGGVPLAGGRGKTVALAARSAEGVLENRGHNPPSLLRTPLQQARHAALACLTSGGVEK
jgi:hypothetical protein